MNTLLEQVIGRINYAKKVPLSKKRAEISTDLWIEQILKRNFHFCPLAEFKRLYSDWRETCFGFNQYLSVLIESPRSWSYASEEYLRNMNLLSRRELKIGKYMKNLCNNYGIIPNFDLKAVFLDGKEALNIWRMLKEFGGEKFMGIISLENEKIHALREERYEDIMGIEKKLGRFAMDEEEILEYCEKFGKMLEE